jgi:ATP-dependent Zn protease
LKIIDKEVKKIIDDCTKKTRELVKEKRELIEGLSDLLLEKETIDLKQIVGVLGERPFEAKSTYKAYLEEVRFV